MGNEHPYTLNFSFLPNFQFIFNRRLTVSDDWYCDPTLNMKSEESTGRQDAAGSVEQKPARLDTAWRYLNEHRELDLDVDIKFLRRKIDWHIVPLMFCCYTMQFLDKVVLNVRIAPSHFVHT